MQKLKRYSVLDKHYNDFMLSNVIYETIDIPNFQQYMSYMDKDIVI
jgi:hypothetical protein